MIRLPSRSALGPLVLSVACLLTLSSSGEAASTFVLISVDGPGEGLNDPTPVSPSGGNPGITLGEARLRAVEFAAATWANLLGSDVPIRVEVRFDSMGGTESSASLGLGGAGSVFRDFAGAPRPSTWYPSAIADLLAGTDLDPSGPDVVLTFNSDTDGDVVLGTSHFYYGFDASPPTGDVDFVSIALHELAHGLGLQTFLDLDTGGKLLGFDDAYMLHLELHGATPPDFPSMSDAQRLQAFTAGALVHWTGPSADAAGVSLTAGVDPSGHLEMYAPDPPLPRSSLEHLDDTVAPDELMEPAYLGPSVRLELTRSLLEDVGWGAAGLCIDASQP